MTTPLRPGLEPLPRRLRALPIDARGWPVPWFVAWFAGPDGVEVPDFRVMDARKFNDAIKYKKCWVCGEPMGTWLAFPLGPMCSITRVISEPPSHLECAQWSVRNCPWLSQPKMVRDTTNLPAEVDLEGRGLAIQRNPGVMCLWITRSFELFKDKNGKPLITVGAPERVEWWAEGRTATRAEVDASITGGLPILLTEARDQGDFAVKALGMFYAEAETWFPKP